MKENIKKYIAPILLVLTILFLVGATVTKTVITDQIGNVVTSMPIKYPDGTLIALSPSLTNFTAESIGLPLVNGTNRYFGKITLTNSLASIYESMVLDFNFGHRAGSEVQAGVYTNGGYVIQFSRYPNDAEFGNIIINPWHNRGPLPTANNSEWQITAPGHMAWSCGYQTGTIRHWQWGIGGAGLLKTNSPFWIYLQYGGPGSGVDLSSPKMFSVPLTARAEGYVNSQTKTFFPGIMARYVDVNTGGPYGIYEFDVFADLGIGSRGVYEETHVNPYYVTQQIRNLAGDHQGTHIIGSLSGNVTNQSGNTSIVLDFADAKLRDIAAQSAALALTTTNTLKTAVGVNAVFRSTILIRSGLMTVTPSYPSGWNTNGFGFPTTIPPASFLRLELEWLYPGGETNVTPVSAFVHKDNTFTVDTDADAYFARVASGGGSFTDVYSNAINNFVITLKSDGTWTNIDALYPFAGATQDTNGQNLVSANYTIKWYGTWGTNNATGIHGDGSTAYGNTQWIPSTTNGFIFSFVKASANTSDKYIMGEGISSEPMVRLMHNGGAAVSWNYNTSPGLDGTSAITYPTSVMASRDGTSVKFQMGGSPIVSTTTSTATGVGTKELYIYGRNGGSPDKFYNGWVQGYAMGKKSLSETQYVTLHNAFVALNSALGR